MKELTELEKLYIRHAFSFMVKSPDKTTRNRANSVKSIFKTELAIISNCYPYQTRDGHLLTKSTANGVKIYKEKTLTYASALNVLEISIDNYFKLHYFGDKPLSELVEIHEIGETV